MTASHNGLDSISRLLAKQLNCNPLRGYLRSKWKVVRNQFPADAKQQLFIYFNSSNSTYCIYIYDIWRTATTAATNRTTTTTTATDGVPNANIKF